MTDLQQTEETHQDAPVTIESRGAALPLGIVDNAGAYHQQMAVRPWRMKEEKELGALRDEHKSANLAEWVSIVLATMFTKLGPYDFASMELPEKRLVISQMFIGDVFYAYVWLRIQCLGAEFPIEFSPAWASKPIKIKADLNTIEIKTADSFEDASWDYALKNPIKVRGKDAKIFKMGPQRWSAIEAHDSMVGTRDTSRSKEVAILASVFATDTIENLPLTSGDVEELSKLDIERLTTLIDDHHIGPQMAVEGSHKGRDFRAPIDWGYDSFFGISSV